jgi:peptidoglycan/LPS O-acetylase OafA/YrhL
VSHAAQRQPIRRPLVRGIVASLCLTAAAAIVALVSGDFGDTQLRVILTTTAVSLYGLLALPAGVLLDRERMRVLAYAVIALSVLGFVLFMNIVWIEWDDSGEVAWKSTLVVSVAAGALAQIAASQSRRRADDSPAIEWLTLASSGAALLLAAMVSIAALAEIDDAGYYRALGAVAVLDVLLLILPPVLRRGRASTAEGAQRVRLVVEADAAVADALAKDVESRGGRIVSREAV